MTELDFSGGLGCAIGELDAHFSRHVVPYWLATGWNASLGLPHESLAEKGTQPKFTGQYRAMACARQLYLFSRIPAHHGHAAQLFESLRHYYYDAVDGGWFFSIDAEGRPLDRKKDLYTHAFVIFACAQYAIRADRRDALEVVLGTSDYVEHNFSIGEGVYTAVSDDGKQGVKLGPLQNPMMHLFEAYLSAKPIAGERLFGERLRVLADGVASTFEHPVTHCIAEKPIGEAGNWIEPGHQFEWYSLVDMAGDILEGSRLKAAMPYAFEFACTHGVDEKQSVVASVSELGVAQDRTARLWAQTEYLRALALWKDERAQKVLLETLNAYSSRFLTDFGWHECLDAEGRVARNDMPCTTPYHMETAYETLRAVSAAV
jgi:mannose/cellobiose epimerase-like protein (N-acyl-D-glucosamine 2-epimerase family)